MASANRDILVVGASVAGPTLAYWLRRYGFNPTVVERSPLLRAGLGGHAVDLFGPAVDIAERMGLLPQVMQAATQTELLSFARPGKAPIDVHMNRLVSMMSNRHVEVMRGELASILYDATRDDVEYLFGDTITRLDQDADGVNVTFEHAARRRFAAVVGADGLHSAVRRLTFGDESQFLRYIGGYFAAFTLPNFLHLDGRMIVYTLPGKLAAMYPVRQTGDARAVLLFRRAQPFSYDHRDRSQQRRLLHETYVDQGWEMPRLLAELDDADDLYVDSISQVVMEQGWSRGRVTLVGDAGYSPGPAVGGGTSIAMVGAYTLAGELSRTTGDPLAAFPKYEDATRELARLGRRVGTTSMKWLIPQTPLQVVTTIQATRLLTHLPDAVRRRLSTMQAGPGRALSTVRVADYE